MENEPTPPIGAVIAGRYRVLGAIGAGGMGSVLSVEHTTLGQRLAMKVMQPKIASDAEFATRFLREARIASSLTSEHIARVFDFGSLGDGALFMTMDLLEGRDLEKELRAQGPLSVELAAKYVIQACDVLAEAHARGIVHRDLKPANLFLCRNRTAEPSIKVLDFGISKSRGLEQAIGDDTLTTTDSTLGSPKYMSPEQLRSPKHVDHRSDLWSLGVILYRLVSGALPFGAESIGAYITEVLTQAPRSLPSHVAQDYCRIVYRCLQKDPAHRYASALNLVQALSPFAPSDAQRTLTRIKALTLPALLEETIPPSVSTAETVATQAALRRGRHRVWGLVSAAAILVAGAATGIWLKRDNPAPVPGDNAADVTPENARDETATTATADALPTSPAVAISSTAAIVSQEGSSGSPVSASSTLRSPPSGSAPSKPIGVVAPRHTAATSASATPTSSPPAPALSSAPPAVPSPSTTRAGQGPVETKL